MKPSAEQVAALQSFAARHGRRWKSTLLDMWMNGRDDFEQESSRLRNIRNQFGPSWLVSFKLPKAN